MFASKRPRLWTLCDILPFFSSSYSTLYLRPWLINICRAVKLFDSEASLFLEQQSKRQADVATGAASKPSTAADGSHAEERTPPNHELASSAATMQEMEQTAIESKPQLDAIETAPSVKRVRVEKQIDIPESLVGLLLSKKGNKQYSTMNSIQKYTHTYISKLRAKKREIQGEDDANEDVATEQGGGEAASAEKQLNAVLDNDSEGDNRRNASKGDEVSVANDIGGDGDDRDDENDNGDDDNENSDDDDDDSDFDDAREPDEASNGSDVNSNNDSEDFESAGEGSPKTKTDKAGEQKRVVVNESYPVESADKATPAQTKTDEARVASAPSGGAVTFVVVSNAEESVDMVIRALQRIINGDPIKIVMENLREEGKKFARIFAQKRSESAAAAVGGASAAAEVPKGKAFNGVRKRGGRSSKSKTNTGKDAMSGDGSAQLKPARTESGKASKSSRKRVASDSASGVAGGDDAVGDAVRGERGDRGPRGSRVGRGGNNAKPRSGPPSSPTTATGQAPTADKAKVAAEASAAGGGGSSMGVFKKRL